MVKNCKQKTTRCHKDNNSNTIRALKTEHEPIRATGNKHEYNNTATIFTTEYMKPHKQHEATTHSLTTLIHKNIAHC